MPSMQFMEVEILNPIMPQQFIKATNTKNLPAMIANFGMNKTIRKMFLPFLAMIW